MRVIPLSLHYILFRFSPKYLKSHLYIKSRRPTWNYRLVQNLEDHVHMNHSLLCLDASIIPFKIILTQIFVDSPIFP